MGPTDKPGECVLFACDATTHASTPDRRLSICRQHPGCPLSLVTLGAHPSLNVKSRTVGVRKFFRNRYHAPTRTDDRRGPFAVAAASSLRCVRRARVPSRERPRPGKAWTAPTAPGLADQPAPVSPRFSPRNMSSPLVTAASHDQVTVLVRPQPVCERASNG
jgi:hypothetical protein